MPTIVDPDNLLDAKNAQDSNQNIFINTALREVTIRNNSATPFGPTLDETGVTLQALYSFLKEEWKNDPNNKGLINYPFPLIAITPEQFEWRFGWKPKDDTSRRLIRTAGWREFAANNTDQLREYVGVISLGNVEGVQTDAPAVGVHNAYFAFYDADSARPPLSAAENFSFPGEVNEAVKTFENDSGSTYDFRNEILTLFVRSYDSTDATTFTGYTFDKTPTTDIGITAGATLPYNVQRFPLSEGVDLDVTVSDLTIQNNSGSGEKYDVSTPGDNVGPGIRYETNSLFSSALGYSNDLQGGPYKFGVIIDADNGAAAANLTKNEIYSWVHRQLRQDTNIEDSDNQNGRDKIGRLQDDPLAFVGPDLQTVHVRNPRQGLNAGEGVAIKNFFASDVNNLFFRSDSSASTLRSFQFTATGTISFAGSIDTLVADSANAKFFVYYEYTKRSTVTDLVISSVGPVAGPNGGTVDSAVLTSATNGFNNTDASKGTTGVTLQIGDYFYLEGLASDLAAGNEQIWEVTQIAGDGSEISARTYDDVSASNQTVTGNVEVREHPINSPDALLVDSASGTSRPITGLLGDPNTVGSPIQLITFSYDYDGNVQGDKPSGAVAGTGGDADAQIIIRAIGLEKGAFVEVANIEIERSTSNSYSVVSSLERNYSNPE